MAGHGMRAGVVLPGGTANQQLEQAVAAEQAGWDGVFVWEAGYGVDAIKHAPDLAPLRADPRYPTLLAAGSGSNESPPRPPSPEGGVR